MITSDSKRKLYRILLQKKNYLMGNVSLETIEEEAEKVAESLRGTDFEGRYTLVFVVTELQTNLEKHPDKIPSECIILHGSSLHEFFGEAFAYRILGLGADSIVSVNADPKESLMRVRGIGETIAERIIRGRNWKNWEELKEGVPGLRNISREYLLF
jgi:hypothetical protein